MILERLGNTNKSSLILFKEEEINYDTFKVNKS